MAVEPAATPDTYLAAFSCRAEVATLQVMCTPAAATGGSALITVGGQHDLVRLTSGTVTFTAADSTMAFPVTVQNLLLAPLGTADGTTSDAAGVRVFFHAEPSGSAEVKNATGSGAFTGTNQPYFAYTAAELGADGILSSDEVSAPKQWQIDMNGAESTTFSGYVHAQYPTAQAYAAHFVQVSAGSFATCALTAAGKAYCWGQAASVLGNGSALAANQGVPLAVAMPPGVTFTQINVGADHACALATDGSAYCWGSDDNGRLGNGAALTEPQHAPSPVVMPAGVSFTRISATAHGCGLGTDGTTYCWGIDGAGQLGNGGALTTSQESPVAVQMPPGVTFDDISTGGRHTCAVSAASLYCWGANLQRQAGDGTATNRDVPTVVAGSR